MTRINKLQELKDMQIQMLDMVGDCCWFWERGQASPEGISASTFMAHIAMSLAMIDEVMESDEEDTRH